MSLSNQTMFGSQSPPARTLISCNTDGARDNIAVTLIIAQGQKAAAACTADDGRQKRLARNRAAAKRAR